MTNRTLPDLSEFTGSERIFKHGVFPSVCYTEGVRYLANEVHAYWLIDFIAAGQRQPEIKVEEFQVWKLKRRDDGPVYDLIVEDGNDNVVWRETIAFYDFPLNPGDTFKLWCVRGELCPTIMLPSEY